MKNSLINTNQHLKDPRTRERMIVNFAYSTGKGEGLDVTKEETRLIYQKALRIFRSKQWIGIILKWLHDILG